MNKNFNKTMTIELTKIIIESGNDIQKTVDKIKAFVYDNRCEISMQYEKENALKEIEYKLVDMEIPCDTNTIEDYYDYYFDCMGYESKQAIDRVVDNIVDEYYENN